jgi:hypothetical protein
MLNVVSEWKIKLSETLMITAPESNVTIAITLSKSCAITTMRVCTTIFATTIATSYLSTTLKAATATWPLLQQL